MHPYNGCVGEHHSARGHQLRGVHGRAYSLSPRACVRSDTSFILCRPVQVSFEVEDSGFQRVLAVDRSKVMVDMLDKAAHGCLEYGNTTACNALGNLCVLQMHDLEASACSLYRELVDLRQVSPLHSCRRSRNLAGVLP